MNFLQKERKNPINAFIFARRGWIIWIIRLAI